MKTVVYSVYGKDVANNILDVNSEFEGYKVTGVCGKPEIARSNRSNQLFYVNGRNIKDKILSSAVDKAYGTLLHEGRFAFCILNLELDPELVDVNVHPAKLEVRFQEENKVFSSINLAVKDALFSNDLTVIEDKETLKEKEDGLREKKEGLFDKYRPNRDMILKKDTLEKLLNKVQEEDKPSEAEINFENKKNNVVTIDFEKELNVLSENKPVVKEEKEEYKGSYDLTSEDDDISLSKLNMSKTENKTIKLEDFNITDEDFKTNTVTEERQATEKKSEGNDDDNEEINEDSKEFVDKKKLFNLKDNSLGTRSDIPKVNKDEEHTQENVFDNLLDSMEKPDLPDYQIIGVGFLTYIFIQIDDEIYIFDQHAAHERVLYEKVKANYYNDGGRESQMLLLPDVLELSKKDMKFVTEHIGIFEKAGFELEEFGDNTIKITGVPAICYEMNTRDLFLDIIDGLDYTSKTTTEEVENRFLATVACKAAVKANMKLSDLEIKTLFDELLSLENPFTCPHGRPTAIRLTKDEIEKKFKRKGF